MVSSSPRVLRLGHSLLLLCHDVRPYRVLGVNVDGSRIEGPALQQVMRQVAGLSMLAAPAGAMEVHFGPSLSTDQVAPVEGWFIGYDLNHDGHLRSADHEIARAYSTVGERVWNDMEHGWWTWDDVFMVGFTPDLPQPTIDFRYERNAATGALQGWLLEFKTFRWCDYFCRDMTFDYGPDGKKTLALMLLQKQ